MPAPAAEKTSILSTALLALVAVVLAGGSFLLISTLMKPAPAVDTGPVPALVALAALREPDDRVWTEADTDTCKAAVNKQADQDDALEGRLWNSGRIPLPSMAKGFSQGSARMVCEMATKPLRLCNATAKQELVTALKDYANRTGGFMKTFGIRKDLVPPILAGVALEAATGPSMGFEEDLSREAMAALATAGFEKVAAAMAPLAEAGLLAPGDFGFMGGGVHPLISNMLAAQPARGNACDYTAA
jgi:hypothetical protein